MSENKQLFRSVPVKYNLEHFAISSLHKHGDYTNVTEGLKYIALIEIINRDPQLN